MSQDDDDDLRFGDVAGDDGRTGGYSIPDDPAELAIDIFRLLFVVLVMGYVILYLAHALFGTPDPTGFI